MRKPCIHGFTLEKNLRCDHGYIQVLIRTAERTVCKNIGPHTKDNQEIAKIYLADRLKEIRNGLIGIIPELPSKKFDEVSKLWFKIWQKEKNPDGTEAHNKESCYKVEWTLRKVLIPVFGTKNFDTIKELDICKWRDTYMDKGLSGTTANRYQAILSAIFTHVNRWVKTEKIRPAFKLPVNNPCEAIEMAPTRKRKRILSQYEASKLKLAFMQLNDLDGWEICKMALKSVLSMKDLKALDIGSEINTVRTKTGVPVNIPLTVISRLNFFGWRTRWEKARELAGLSDLQFRDLRKSPMNWVTGHHDLKLISQYMGHASIKTTEKAYMVTQIEKMKPIADELTSIVDNL